MEEKHVCPKCGCYMEEKSLFTSTYFECDNPSCNKEKAKDQDESEKDSEKLPNPFYWGQGASLAPVYNKPLSIPNGLAKAQSQTEIYNELVKLFKKDLKPLYNKPLVIPTRGAFQAAIDGFKERNKGKGPYDEMLKVLELRYAKGNSN